MYFKTANCAFENIKKKKIKTKPAKKKNNKCGAKSVCKNCIFFFSFIFF